MHRRALARYRHSMARHGLDKKVCSGRAHRQKPSPSTGVFLSRSVGVLEKRVSSCFFSLLRKTSASVTLDTPLVPASRNPLVNLPLTRPSMSRRALTNTWRDSRANSGSKPITTTELRSDQVAVVAQNLA